VTESGGAAEIGLETGDIIHSVNDVSVQSVESLRNALDAAKPGSTIALQVERDGQLQFIEFDMQ
jgi:serine protease Do